MSVILILYFLIIMLYSHSAFMVDRIMVLVTDFQFSVQFVTNLRSSNSPIIDTFSNVLSYFRTPVICNSKATVYMRGAHWHN